MKKANERRAETPLQTAARLREKHHTELSVTARKPIPRDAYDEMWGSTDFDPEFPRSTFLPIK